MNSKLVKKTYRGFYDSEKHAREILEESGLQNVKDFLTRPEEVGAAWVYSMSADKISDFRCLALEDEDNF